jgi:tRNA pseudouridine13 synthase
MDTSKLPYLTPDLPGVGGRIKEHVEDFLVEEQPLYEACGEGTHVYFRVRKAGIPTPAAVERIARHMGVHPHEIGLAGLKDAHAVTEQTMSLEHADPDRLAGFADGQLAVTWTGRHTNKLRPGHLAGNRFTIRLRGVGEAQLDDARAVLEVLARRGVPNYYGRQRFGHRLDTDALGEALIRDDLDAFLSMFLGRSREDDPPDCKAARDAFDAGYMDRAIQRWPRHYSNERKALIAYKKTRKPRRAVSAIDKRMLRFYVSAWQSARFNDVLARRIDTLDRVLAGDLAQKTDSGGVFRVEDPAIEQPRADRKEISPTGPLLGYRVSLAEGEPGRIEHEVLDAGGIDLESTRKIGRLKLKGSRRALRFLPAEADIAAGTDDRGEYLQVTFTAPSGSYATVLLREIMKDDRTSSVS